MDPIVFLSLPDTLTFLVAGGAAYIAFWLLDNVQWLVLLDAEKKRYAAYILTGGLAFVLWVLKMVLIQEPLPLELRDWLLTGWAVGAGAVVGNQLLHARFSLKKSKE